ncbi:MAG: SDR family NAD(P)-dependent oxidoreductase, partial [Planctomycetota bacterium]
MTLSQSLEKRHALVCGASSGLGREVALALAAQGASLTLFARSADRLTELAESCSDSGAPSALAIPVDLEDEGALAAATDQVLEQGPVHILINNSGGPPGGPLLDASPEDFLAPMRRHLFAAHYLVQRLVPGM